MILYLLFLKKFLPKTNLSIHLYTDETADEFDDTADDAELGSSVRFADVAAPPNWADRITGLVAAISAGADN